MLTEQEYQDYKFRSRFATVVVGATILMILLGTVLLNREPERSREKRLSLPLTAISGTISKSGYYSSVATVRLPDGTTRELGIDTAEASHCRIGSQVSVLQRGLVFRLAPDACRASPLRPQGE